MTKTSLYYKNMANNAYADDQLQLARIMAEAWYALTPSGESMLLVDKIQQRRQIQFNKYLTCTKQSDSNQTIRYCLKKLLKYQPDYQPAVEALRALHATSELTKLKQHQRDEKARRLDLAISQKLDTQVMIEDKNPIKKLSQTNNHESEKNKSKMKQVHSYIAKKQWIPAAQLLLEIKEHWPAEINRLTELRFSLADKIYFQGQRLLRTNIAKTIELWELVLSLNRRHSQAKIKLMKAYKIRRNLYNID